MHAVNRRDLNELKVSRKAEHPMCGPGCMGTLHSHIHTYTYIHIYIYIHTYIDIYIYIYGQYSLFFEIESVSLRQTI